MKHRRGGPVQGAKETVGALDALESAAAQVCHAIPPSRRSVAARWAELTVRWRDAADLTGVRSVSSVIRELMVPTMPVLSLVTIDPEAWVLDYGCGSGCTAVALWAATGCGRWTLVDRRKRKVIFCRYALSRCRIDSMEALGVDEWRERELRADIVVARALPPDLSEPGALGALVRPGGTVLRWIREREVRKTADAVPAGWGDLWVEGERH